MEDNKNNSGEDTQEILEFEITEEVIEESEVLLASEAEVQEEQLADSEDTENSLAASEEETVELSASEEESVEAAEEAAPEVFVDSDQVISILESLLFASDRPIGMGTFKQVFAGTNINTRQIRKSLDELAGSYASPSRGVVLEEVTGGWQLRTKVDNMDFLRKISKQRPFRLSGPALEVLAIIAYKQPIVKNEVDQIRGVESGHLVRALMEKGLVSFEGKTDLPGKPMAYATTRKFLEIFGLRNVQELPSLSEIDQLLPEGIGEENEKETLSQVTDMMSQAIGSSYSEGEEELMSITEKIQSIDTSSEFFEQEKQRIKQKKERERAEDIREALAVGEEVDPKDVRWLERYDVQQALELSQAEAAAATVNEAGAEEQVNELDAALAESDEVTPNETSEAEMYFDSQIKDDFVEDEQVPVLDEPERESEI